MRSFRWAIYVAFVDFLNVMLCVFVLLLSTMRADHAAHMGNVVLPTVGLVTLTWPGKSATDLDLWVKGPDGRIVGYPAKDGIYMHLNRDDMGSASNTFSLNGKPVTVHRNVENVEIERWVPGEWVINVHYYFGTVPSEMATVKVVKLNPYQVIYEGKLPVASNQEETFVSFVVNADGTISDRHTDLQIPFRKQVK